MNIESGIIHLQLNVHQAVLLYRVLASANAGDVIAKMSEPDEATMRALTDLFKISAVAAIHQTASPTEAVELVEKYFGKTVKWHGDLYYTRPPETLGDESEVESDER